MLLYKLYLPFDAHAVRVQHARPPADAVLLVALAAQRHRAFRLHLRRPIAHDYDYTKRNTKSTLSVLELQWAQPKRELRSLPNVFYLFPTLEW